MIRGLKSKIKNIPVSPGVYFFLDKNKKPLYIGKAANLKNRLKSYADNGDPRVSKMLSFAHDIYYKKTDSEMEALILESQFIKKLKPKFNIKLRDDKQYFFVGITRSTGSGQAREKFPKIFLTHQPNKEQSAKRLALSDGNLQNAMRLAISNKQSGYIGPFTDGAALKTTLKLLRRIFPYCTCKQKHNNFCLNYHIGNCIGYCCLKRQNSNFKIKMKNEKFYKKNIKIIKDILVGKRRFLIKTLQKEMKKMGQKYEFEKAIELRNRIKKLERVFENANILHYFDASKYRGRDVLEELKNIFRLPKLPRRIEGYDVSNIQGINATGAMVVFIDGKPDKNEYRKFKIRPKKMPNDTAMIREVLMRRLNHPEWQFPDLILIDGGKAQLNTAADVTSKFKIPIIALTKNLKHKGDHIFTTNLSYAKVSKGKKKMPIKLSGLPDSVKNLILFIDSEAHRFAISYYRKLHRKIIV